MKETVKEALVNSLMHAYYDSDRPIKIIDYNDYFEFYNPGEMRVTEDEFFHGSISRTRNAVIANLFRRVGIAEKEAKGTIADTVIQHNLRPPEISATADSTYIKLWKLNMESTLEGLDPIEELVMQFGVEVGVFKISETIVTINKARKIPITEYKIRKAFETLLDKEYIEYTGKGRARSYTIRRSKEAERFGVLQFFKMMEDKIYRPN
ncbi:ATP-binding protein [Loigolactobacillus zhaoyuanensis]|nr:ATP-binding protein [Loigolactobacillus zhaoyuanensis]